MLCPVWPALLCRGWMSVTFVYCVETAKERYVECESETIPEFSNGIIFSDRE